MIECSSPNIAYDGFASKGFDMKTMKRMLENELQAVCMDDIVDVRRMREVLLVYGVNV